jgi:hypothetical protein
VVGKVKNGQYWKGSPAVKSGKARHPWPDHRPPRAAHWVFVYGVSSLLLGALPLAALGAGLAVLAWLLVGVLLHGTEVAGWLSVISAICLFGGLQSLLIGVLGEYLGRIFLTVSGKPQSFLRSLDHFEAP